MVLEQEEHLQKIFNRKTIFNISLPAKDYVCVVERPLFAFSPPRSVIIRLLERKQASFTLQNLTLFDYLGGHHPNTKCDYSFHVDTSGKCFVLMRSDTNDYIGLVYFNLLHPYNTLNILFEYNQAVDIAICHEPLLVANEQEEASETLIFWTSQPSDSENDAILNIDGFNMLKPNASLQYLVKRYLRKLYTIDEIHSLDIPKMLKQYLLA